MIKISRSGDVRPLSKKLFCQRGFTLIEFTIVLTIVGAIIGILWIGASKAMAERKMVEVEGDTTEFITSIREFYSGRQLPANNASNLINNTLLGASAVPNRLIRKSSASVNCQATPASCYLKHGFDMSGNTANSVMVYSGNNAGQTGAFTLWLAGLRREECIRLGTRFGAESGAARGGGIIGVNINSGAFDTSVTPTEASAACSATGSNSVGVVFAVR